MKICLKYCKGDTPYFAKILLHFNQDNMRVISSPCSTHILTIHAVPGSSLNLHVEPEIRVSASECSVESENINRFAGGCLDYFFEIFKGWGLGPKKNIAIPSKTVTIIGFYTEF